MQLHQRAVLQQGHACTMPLLPQPACWGEPGPAVPRLGASPSASFPTASGSVQMKKRFTEQAELSFLSPVRVCKEDRLLRPCAVTPTSPLPHFPLPAANLQLSTATHVCHCAQPQSEQANSSACVDCSASWPEAADDVIVQEQSPARGYLLRGRASRLLPRLVSGGQWAEARPEAVSPWCAFAMETFLRLRQHTRGVQLHLRL